MEIEIADEILENLRSFLIAHKKEGGESDLVVSDVEVRRLIQTALLMLVGEGSDLLTSAARVALKLEKAKA